MPPVQFELDDTSEGFYVFVGESVVVYETYDAAVDEIQTKLSGDTDSFVAEVTIEHNGSEDTAINLEQVGWQRIIQDMAAMEGADA
jgi:hypothetical protein